MAVAQANVLDGLYSYLTADSTFNTAIGGSGSAAGRISFGVADFEETLPYVVFNMVSATFADTMDKGGYEYRVQFTAYDDTEAGPRAVADLMDKLRTRLHRQQFSVTGHSNMTAVEDAPRGPFKEDDIWRMDADYFIRGFET